MVIYAPKLMSIVQNSATTDMQTKQQPSTERVYSCDMEDVVDRRLFFDWFIHDYIIPDKNDTNIKLFLKGYQNQLLDEIERNTAITWSKSQLRFYEILDIKNGIGYAVKDILNDAGNNNNNQFFVFDKSTSVKVNKFDIEYM